MRNMKRQKKCAIIFLLTIGVLSFVSQTFAQSPRGFRLKGNIGDKNIVKVRFIEDKKMLGSSYAQLFGLDTLTVDVNNGDFIIADDSFSEPSSCNLEFQDKDGKWQRPLEINLISFPGDDITINAGNTGLKFSGKGSAKYSFKNSDYKIYLDTYFKYKMFKNEKDRMSWGKIDSLLSYHANIFEKRSKNLAAYRRHMDQVTYSFLLSDLIYFYKSFALQTLSGGRVYGPDKFVEDPKAFHKAEINQARREKEWDQLLKINKTDLSFSESYLNYTMDKGVQGLITQGVLFYGLPANQTSSAMKFSNRFEAISNAPLPPKLKEQLLVRLVLPYHKVFDAKHYSNIINYSVYQITNPGYKSILLNLENRLTRLQKGSTILDWTFLDTAGRTVKLDDYKGKAVFVDFWYTGCGACSLVAKALPEVEKQFADKKDVVFLSLSIDLDKETWLKSIKPDEKKSQKYAHASDYYSGEHAQYWNANTDNKSARLGQVNLFNPFVKTYVPDNGYPTLMLIGKDGKMYMYNAPRPDSDKQGLIKLISTALLDSSESSVQ